MSSDFKNLTEIMNSNRLLTTSKGISLLLTGLIFLYTFLYPPFLSGGRVDIVFRLTTEASVLLILSLTVLLRIHKKNMMPLLIIATMLMILYWLFSLDENRNVLSFFNKIVFFILLLNAIHENYSLNAYLKKMWIFVWIYFSISAIIAVIGFATGIIPFSMWETGKHLYYFNPLVGTIMTKDIEIVVLPRYAGWMCVPSALAFFFGANVFIAQNLFIKQHRARYFKWINAIAGVLTFSATFYLFFIGYLLCQHVYPKRLKTKTIISLLILLSLPLVWYMLSYMFEQPEAFKFTSLPNRAWSYQKAWGVFTEMHISHVLFGFGILPLFREVGGGVSSGLLGLLLGRGFLIFCFLMYLIFRHTKYHTGFLIYILFYSLVLDLFSSPLFFFGLVLGYESYFQKQLLPHMYIHSKKSNLAEVPRL